MLMQVGKMVLMIEIDQFFLCCHVSDNGNKFKNFGISD